MKRCSTIKGNHADIQVTVRIQLTSAPKTIGSWEMNSTLSSITDRVMSAIHETQHLSRLSDLKVRK